VFQALPRLSPEATRAIREAARFLCAAIPVDSEEQSACGH